MITILPDTFTVNIDLDTPEINDVENTYSLAEYISDNMSNAKHIGGSTIAVEMSEYTDKTKEAMSQMIEHHYQRWIARIIRRLENKLEFVKRDFAMEVCKHERNFLDMEIRKLELDIEEYQKEI